MALIIACIYHPSHLYVSLDSKHHPHPSITQLLSHTLKHCRSENWTHITFCDTKMAAFPGISSPILDQPNTMMPGGLFASSWFPEGTYDIWNPRIYGFVTVGHTISDF
jgi:hypothetical protein